MIKIIKEFKEYAFYKPFGVFKELKNTGTDINIFGTQIAICLSSEYVREYIWFGIINDIFNTKKIDIESISSDWLFLNNIIDVKSNMSEKFTIYFQNYLNKMYMMVSSSKRSREAESLAEDMYGDDILHIYGIWEVELSENFKNSLYS